MSKDDAAAVSAPQPTYAPCPLEQEHFPRGLAMPGQSPLFWVAEKDRYLRQLLIRDIEAQTGRRLIVYFADCSSPHSGAQILASDDAYLAELLGPGEARPTDILLETLGGSTDATEKLVGLLRNCAPDLRAFVPCRAKSNGTLLALAAKEVVMGVTSELGPIDPLLTIGPQARVSAHLLMGEGTEPFISRMAEDAVSQTKKLATSLLATGMLKGHAEGDIATIVDKLAGPDHFHSHGSVIDADEAADMGLCILHLKPDDPLWQSIWLLRCMYAHDLQHNGLIKVFEGRTISNTLKASASDLTNPAAPPC